MKGSKEGWITFANGDQEAKNSLVLLKSLHKVYTSKKILLILTSKISNSFWCTPCSLNLSFQTKCPGSVQNKIQGVPTTMWRGGREVLVEEFDGVYMLPETNIEAIDLETRAKIFCWSLFENKKLLFIRNSSVVLENPDSIFELEGTTIGENGILLLMPSLHMYQKLNKATTYFSEIGDGIKLARSNHFNKKFRDFVIETTGAGILEKKYDFKLDNTSKVFSLPTPIIVNFSEEIYSYEISKEIICPEFLSFYNKLQHEVKMTIEKTKNLFCTGNSSEEPIAIVGMSCRMPGANNVEDYWRILENGECWVRGVPEGRWSTSESVFRPPDTMKTKAGFLSCAVDEFDAKFFGISPVEMNFMDPQQRLGMEVSWEALEDAAINPHSLKGSSTGVFCGIWTHQYSNLTITSGFKQDQAYREYLGNSFGVGNNLILLRGCVNVW